MVFSAVSGLPESIAMTAPSSSPMNRRFVPGSGSITTGFLNVTLGNAGSVVHRVAEVNTGLAGNAR